VDKDKRTCDTALQDNVVRNGQKMLNQAQIDHLSTLCFINKIDDHLKIVTGVRISGSEDDVSRRVLLVLELYFEGEKIDDMSFDLHNFAFEDIVHVAKNIRSNEFIMQEVDNYLAGDIE
jgi:hypothetical protein